jgi:hypothetical protein
VELRADDDVGGPADDQIERASVERHVADVDLLAHDELPPSPRQTLTERAAVVRLSDAEEPDLRELDGEPLELTQGAVPRAVLRQEDLEGARLGSERRAELSHGPADDPLLVEDRDDDGDLRSHGSSDSAASCPSTKASSIDA